MNEAEEKLVWALRSGVFRQTRNVLFSDHQGQVGLCCLMVANVVLDPGGFELNLQDNDNGGRKEYNIRTDEDEFTDFLTDAAQVKLGWSRNNGDLSFAARDGVVLTLAQLNDNIELSFDQIADLIEAGLVQHVDTRNILEY